MNIVVVCLLVMVGAKMSGMNHVIDVSENTPLLSKKDSTQIVQQEQKEDVIYALTDFADELLRERLQNQKQGIFFEKSEIETLFRSDSYQKGDSRIVLKALCFARKNNRAHSLKAVLADIQDDLFAARNARWRQERCWEFTAIGCCWCCFFAFLRSVQGCYHNVGNDA